MALKHLPSYISFLPKHVRNNAMEGFRYTAQAIPLAGVAGTVVVATVAIQNNSDFLWTSTAGVARDPAALQTVFPNPAVTIMANDSGSGNNLFQQPLDWPTCVGTAQLPDDADYPFYIKQGGELTITFTQLDVQAYDIRLALRGFKVYNFPADINQG